MTPSLLLALALLTQPHPRPVEPRVRDLLFAEAQEAWVADVVRPHRFTEVLPPDAAKAIRRLGCEHHECRDDAAEHLTAMGDDAVLVILWGRRAADAEIRDRCERLWQGLFVCPTCKGDGQVMGKTIGVYGPEPYGCNRCYGTGDLRWYREWSDIEAWTLVARPFDRVMAWKPVE